ncbi:MAG: peptidase M22 [Clostridia bacterium]|nr:peptidase M22 [Clostridia bacterium]
MKKLFLGLDTSNYTTSAAVCDEDGRILLNRKKLLPVKEGERGLRQSDAVFHHVRAMEETAEAMREIRRETAGNITAVGCSVAPRDAEGSYMPCFLVGSGVGRMASAVLDVPLYSFSHQAGHMMAAAYSACEKHGLVLSEWINKPFLAFHISGGTTDIIHTTPDAEKILQAERIGGTLDINAGQLIDRLGVKMGLPFPCGAAMDTMAVAHKEKVPKAPVTVKELSCNLSGLENKALQLLEETDNNKPVVSKYVLHAVAMTLLKLTENLEKAYPDLPILYAGGVMSSRYVRPYLEPHGMFADAVYASDNAAGTALLTAESWRRGAEHG